ncbi:MAG TPA: GNAT family protein [Solirubrobacteraceae bacterium]|nr:GNAT family protein [Solirubrobacteraceae bacterium]
MVAFPELQEPLRDELIALRFGAERDIPEILIAHQDDPTMYVRLGAERPPSGAELGREAERAEADRLAGSHLELTIVETGSDDCRGRIAVGNVDDDAARAELRVWVAPECRRRGYARRALALAAPWLFEACGLKRVAVLTETDNAGMLGAADGAGFVREGVLRGYWRGRRTRIDAVVLSLLPADLR